MYFYFIAKTGRREQIIPIGLESIHIQDSKNTFGIFAPPGIKIGSTAFISGESKKSLKN